MSDIQKLSEKLLSELIAGAEYSHCHKTKNEEKAIDIIKEIFNVIGKKEKNFEQVIGREEIFY